MSEDEVRAADVLQLIHRHLGPDWLSVTPDDLVISKIKSGFVNRNYVIERRHDGHKLLLKMYGGNVATDDADITLPIEQEILVCDTWSRVGGGPKLLAVFPSGRMEEFIDSHMITKSEYQDPGIRKELAQAVAKFHSMDLPFRRPAFDYHHLLTRMFRDFVANEKESMVKNPIFQQMNVDVTRLTEYDFGSDLLWLEKALQPEHHRMVFTHGDLHRQNILIRSSDSKPILIDIQESGYNWRGRDLGLCLISSVVGTSNVKAGSAAFPSEEFCNAFFDDYMEQIEKLVIFHDIDRKGKDSNEHLMMETLIGGMVSLMYVILLIMSKNQIMITAAPELAVVLIVLLDSYVTCRSKFLQRYPA